MGSRNRTVNEYHNSEALRNALCDREVLDWTLNCYDPETTNVQSMEEELHRLMVLKSYLILDSQPEKEFERITSVCCRIFKAPICLVSLVDLGRQWFKSNRGLDARETSRSLAFCSHTIQSKEESLVVPDATKDFRFKDNALVMGAPFIRFYAGASLVSPEGYKLGSLCVIDRKVRPEGLTQDEIETLRDMASMVVKALVERRQRLLSRQHPAKLIACTAHDLMTPLSGVQLSLALLLEDDGVASALTPQQMDMIATASSCTDIMVRICESAIQSLRQNKTTRDSTNSEETTSASNATIVTHLPDLVKSLRVVLDSVPLQVPLVITLDRKVPESVLCDDLKLFRSTINLLNNATTRASSGTIHLRISLSAGCGDRLIFECEDNGDSFVENDEDGPAILSRLLDDEGDDAPLWLSSMAAHVQSLNGTFGVRLNHEKSEDGLARGSVFWFSVPLMAVPDGYKHKPASLSTLRGRLSSSLLARVASASMESLASRRGNPGMSNETTANSKFLADAPTARSPVLPAEFLAKTSEILGVRSRTAAMTGVGLDHDVQQIKRTNRVLVIEDSLVIRKTLTRALNNLDYEVTQAVNGLEGLERLKETLYDFVLLDFLMPVMDGLDCVKQYRVWENENRPSYRQWIVGISAHVSVEDSDQGLQAGMDTFYPKPITMKTLGEIRDSKAVRARALLLDESHKGASHPILVTTAATMADPASRSASSAASESKTLPSAIVEPQTKKVRSMAACLVAVENTDSCAEYQELLDCTDWSVTVVKGEEETLQQLRKRNWDVVLVDQSLAQQKAVRFIHEFREWEAKNRVNEQRNLFLVCGSNLPDQRNENSVVQPPSGFNGALRKPVVFQELNYLVKRKDLQQLNIVVRH